jgi:hypothetical protein
MPSEMIHRQTQGNNSALDAMRYNITLERIPEQLSSAALRRQRR